ncbi:MAG: HlyD family efflux transporter periplasmic adaptor subunit [Saprospiraceae bacterium]|nr:HlyD family efflux transporter periplasmic adaptor subunit [Saprospiraceae bacterium]
MEANQLDQIQLRSEEVQEILTRVPHWLVRWGNLVIFGILMMLLYLSWVVKYPDIIAAEASLTTVIPPQKEYANASGRLEIIFVSNNQTVERGQRLAVIENTASTKDVLRLQEMVDQIALNQSTFYFPFDSLPVLLLGEIETSFTQFETDYYSYLLNKEWDPFQVEESANAISKTELRQRLLALQQQMELGEKELSIKAKDLRRQEQLHKDGAISQMDLEEKQLSFVQVQKNQNNIILSISQIKQAIGEAQKRSQATKINRNKTELALLKTVIRSFQQLKNAIKDWELKYMLKSEIEGQVSFLDYYTANQVVRQGDLVFTLIPADNREYLARLRAPKQNAGKLARGQAVNIRVDNYPSDEFGVLKGIVKHVSPLTDREGNYILEVQLPDNLITSYNQTIEFRQEMTGSAEIITEDLRLIDRFFYQLRQILHRT